MASSLQPSAFDAEEKAPLTFRSLHKEINRVFEEFRNVLPIFNDDEPLDGNGKLIPKLDISESEKSIKIEAELPGVAEKNIDVSVSGNVLTLTGEKSSHRQEDEKGYKLVERSFGSFARSLPLSFDIDPEGISAQFDNGVLKIVVKKPPESETKSQKIKISKAK